ncbi:MAG TPA: FtsX-like permease family protein, partial [Bryobacteraceae bacterium]|nr:FtsX-like permease family protein [Bryobacteraceae bacterium]
QELMPEWLTVLGVVGDIGSFKSAAPQNAPAFFRPLAQIDASEVTILVRSQTDASHALPIMSRIVKGLTTSPLFQVHTASEIKDMEAVGLRIPAMLFAVCGLSGLLLSAIGTYGVLSLAARQRTREIGIRLALGATPPAIFRSMVLQGSRQVAVGIATGLVGGLILTRVLYSLFASLQWLVGINVAVAAILAVVGMVAVAVPAFSASRLQPHIALRE